MTSSLKKIMLNILTGVLYISFFVVQLFFNYSSFSRQATDAPASTYLHAIPLQGQKNEAKITNKNASKKNTSNIRLNKRFQPASLPSFIVSISAPIQFFGCLDQMDKPKDYLLIASILTDSLRGPPVVT